MKYFIELIDSTSSKENEVANTLSAENISAWKQAKERTERYIGYPSTAIEGISPFNVDWSKAKDSLDDFIRLVAFLRIPDPYSDLRNELKYAPNKTEIIEAWKRAKKVVDSYIEHTNNPSKHSFNESNDVPIMGSTHVTLEQAKRWAKSRGATSLFISLADIYWRLAPIKGVNPWVAYCQAAKETGYGRFGGVIDSSYHNPCGLKTRHATGDRPEDHQRFNSWEEGISAHLDHLALYTGAPGYPKTITTDPRHFRWILGKAKTVLELDEWAGDPNYAPDLLKLVLSV